MHFVTQPAVGDGAVGWEEKVERRVDKRIAVEFEEVKMMVCGVGGGRVWR